MSVTESSTAISDAVSADLSSAQLDIGFSILDGRLNISNDDGYVVYYKIGTTVYKMTGSYSSSGLSDKEKINETKNVKATEDKGTAIGSNVTSFFVNTKSLAESTVTLDLRVNSGSEESKVDKPVSVSISVETTVTDDSAAEDDAAATE
jgi:hypothetical protein